LKPLILSFKVLNRKPIAQEKSAALFTLNEGSENVNIKVVILGNIYKQTMASNLRMTPTD